MDTGYAVHYSDITVIYPESQWTCSIACLYEHSLYDEHISDIAIACCMNPYGIDMLL